jgi:hypothetical protein
MRILTWNCNRGPKAAKLPLLAPFKPTISVLQECPCPKNDDTSTLWWRAALNSHFMTSNELPEMVVETLGPEKRPWVEEAINQINEEP